MAGPPQWKDHPGFVGVVPRSQRPQRRSSLQATGRRGRTRRSAWQKVIATLRKRTTRCAACDVHHLLECNGRYEETHHVLPRGRGGKDTLANALPVSHVHHSWIHRNPKPAERLGLLAKTTHPSSQED